jgi:hypothetical protein
VCSYRPIRRKDIHAVEVALALAAEGHEAVLWQGSARLLSQELADARLDWRAGGSKLRVEPDRLPAAVETACLVLLRRLGLVFGCFDFIVTPEGEHVFLEVNTAGQFLWVEEANPELPMLAPFVAFLLAKRADFRWQPTAAPIRHIDFHPAAVAAVAALAPHHVDAEAVFVEREDESAP